MDASGARRGPDPTRSDAALAPMPPGPTLRIRRGAISAEIAPEAGGRVASIMHQGVEWLLPHAESSAAMIAWGSYPMVPWAGRIRNGGFAFEGRSYRLPANLGAHAIHGCGFALPWQVVRHEPSRIELALDLPRDERWPFGGHVRQRIEAGVHWLRMDLSVSAAGQAMPCVLGWHPWLPTPEHLEFAPERMYPRDADDIARMPTVDPAPGPWDDCFVNHRPVLLRRAGQTLRLRSDCNHWVVFNRLAHCIAVEPQSGPPDAFNLTECRLAPGETRSAWFLWEWLDPQA